MVKGKWHTADSFDGERLLKQHFYIPAMRGKPWEDAYEGNRSACKLKGGIVDENEKFVNIESLYSEEQRLDCCKKCLKIVNYGI
jgi:hypothetical protein